MADDGLFDNEGNPAPAADEGGREGRAEDNPKSIPKAEVDPKSVEAALEKIAGPIFKEMGGALQGINQRLTDLERPKGTDLDSEDKEKLERLLANPDAVIEGIAKDVVTRTTGPLWHSIMKDKMETSKKVAVRAVEDEYGEGAWNEFFEEPVANIMKDFPAELKMSEGGYLSAVAQVRGAKYDQLKPKALEQDKVKSKRRESGDFQVLPGGRQSPPKSRMSDDEKAYLAVLKENDIDMSEEDYMKSKGIRTLDDYLAAFGGNK